MFSLSWKEWSVGAFVCLMGLGLWSVKGIWADKKPTSVVEDESYEMFATDHGRVAQSAWTAPAGEPQQTPNYQNFRKNRKPRPQEPSDLGTDTVSNPEAPAVAAAAPAPVKPADTKDGRKKAADDAKAKKEKALAEAKAKARAQQQKSRLQAEATALEARRAAAAAAARAADANNNNPNNPNNTAAAVAFVPTTPAPVPATDSSADEEEAAKLSPGQWFSLLQAQPTAANAAKFKAAKSQVGDKDYYDIIAKLLVDSQADRQKLALSLLQRDYSISTFEFLVKPPAQVQANEPMMTAMAALVKTYNSDRARFSVLAAALNSKDQLVVTTSQSLILEALRRRTPADTGVQSGTSTSTIPRGAVVSYSQNDFLVFKASLGRLMSSQVPEVAQRAREIYTSLWQDAAGSQQTASTQPVI